MAINTDKKGAAYTSCMAALTFYGDKQDIILYFITYLERAVLASFFQPILV